MADPDDRPVVEIYSDLLCVWAWIAQPRLEAVMADFGDRVTLRSRCIDVFGNAHGKIRNQWGADDGFERFGAHVRDAAAGHEHAPVHGDVWRGARPTGSLPAHLHLKAAELCASNEQARDYERALREAFFAEGQDISRAEVLARVARAQGLDVTALQAAQDDGRALAALAADQQAAREGRIAGSPTWVLNEGRQILYGNVGYRIVRANLEAYLQGERGGASWC